MTNDELNRLLKSAKVPRRTENFWSEFPKRISGKIHWLQLRTDEPPAREAMRFAEAFILGALGLAAVCIGLTLVQRALPAARSRAQLTPLADAKKYYAEIEAMFPNQVQAIVFDTHGAHLVLSDKADVPSSPPYYVKVCGTKGCEGFVTFSGQQIQFNGERCEVLADEQGSVMLVGSHRVWSENQPSESLRVEAKSLSAPL